MTKTNKKDKNKKKPAGKMPPNIKGSFLGNFIASVLILFLTISIYSYLGGSRVNEQISISE